MTWQEMRLDIMAALAPAPDDGLVRAAAKMTGVSTLEAEARLRYNWAAALVAERERRKAATEESVSDV